MCGGRSAQDPAKAGSTDPCELKACPRFREGRHPA